MVAFAPGAVLTAANLNTAFNALTIRTVTGVSDTLVLADNGGGVTYSNASATTSTIPPNSSVAFAVGTKIVLINLGAGVVTVTAGAGVTVNGATLTLAQDAGGTCIKTATNTWSFLPFSSGVGAADFSDTATGTYTGFKYLTFTASGTLTVTKAGFADLLILGGGGGGGGGNNAGSNLSSGAGAGGHLQITNAYLSVGTLTCTVGAGGVASTSFSQAGGTGNASRLDTYYGIGGGAGGPFSLNRGGGGGSGGGSGGGASADNASQAGASGVAGQGNNGGAGGPLSSTSGGGGGGGSSAVGANASLGTAGAGGAGTSTSLDNVATTRAGGGGGNGTTAGGAGGSGGGGAGGTGVAAGTAGTVNTGGGGGGGGGANAGAGGSGLIIVRVAV